MSFGMDFTEILNLETFRLEIHASIENHETCLR